MQTKILKQQQINEFEQYLIREEKSTATIEKYLRDVSAFFVFVQGRYLKKELVAEYKNYLLENGYAVRSVNSMIASVNSLLSYVGRGDCKVKNIKIQRQIYCAEDKELTKSEYLRLLSVSKNSPQLNVIMQTICATGIRISELKYFTVENVKQGEVVVNCKGKIRTILIPGKLRKLLMTYARKKRIYKGCLFVTKKGNAVNRSNIWAQMKKLCEKANVKQSKVFPHNLRKLFARTFYTVEKDIAKLADILGHGSIETTRIYIMTSGNEHRRKIEKLGLIFE